MNVSPLFVGLALLHLACFSRLHGAEQPAGAPAAVPQARAERVKVDVNTAEIPALEAVPEIGTNFANAIVAARPFKSVDDLDRVLKLGPEKMKALKLKVTASAVKPPQPPPARSTPDNRAKADAKPTKVNNGEAIDGKEVAERYDRDTERRAAEKSEQKK